MGRLRYYSCMMTKAEIQKLDRRDKMWLFETLWDDLASAEGELEMPDWHKLILDERLKAVDEGIADFIDWDEAKRQISKAVR